MLPSESRLTVSSFPFTLPLRRTLGCSRIPSEHLRKSGPQWVPGGWGSCLCHEVPALGRKKCGKPFRACKDEAFVDIKAEDG